jgi:hypothetical protein
MCTKRSYIAAIVIWIVWVFVAFVHLADSSGAIPAYLFIFGQCLLAILLIPAVVIGLWALCGLPGKELTKNKLRCLWHTYRYN